MTSLKIIPNFEKKTAKFEGTIAGGERVRVEISDANKYIGGLNSLRLRAVGSQGETLAQFPFENSADTWVQGDGKIICELNLNTDKLLEAVPPASRVMVLFVLDDGKNEVLYFKSFCAVDHWPRKVGEEEPVDLGGYADFVKDATESIASAEVAIEKASENAMNASKNAEEAAKNAKEAVATVKKIESSLSTKADKTALDTEISRATHSEAQIDSKVDTIIADDAGKSARTIAAEEVAKVVADAPADFDTLKEIAEYIESDKTGAAQMVTKIDANAKAIAAEAQRAQEAEAALRGTVDGKADKVANATSGNLAAIDSNGNLADSGKAIGNFALAESLAPFFELRDYEVGDLCTSFDNDEQHKGTWLYKCILAPDPLQAPTPPEIDTTHWALATVEDVLAALRRTVAGKVDASSLAPVAFSSNYDDLRGKPGNVSEFANDAGYLTAHQSWSDVKPSGGITASDLAAAVQTSLGKADTALQAHQDISGKVDKEAGKGLSTNDYTNEDKAKLGTAYTPDNPPPAPDLSGYATKNEIPYSLIEVTLADRINLTDRAVNKVTADGSLNHIQFVFPEKKAGKSRDFFLRLIITGETVPTLSFSEPNGDSVSFDADYDSWADIEQGVNILMFTDTEE